MIKILNIEDSEIDHELILRHLKKGGLNDIHAERVETEDELREALRSEKWTIVISDYNVPGFDPMTALSIVREASKDLPFIVVSGLVGEESVADMMKAGVEDFVIKSRLERLAPVIKRSLRELEIHEQEVKSRTIAKKAFEAKEQMLAIVYHDIKNPLAAIQLDAQMLELLSSKEPSEEVMNDLRIQAKRILRTVDRLKVLVTDLLEQNNPTQEVNAEHSFIIRKSYHNPVQTLNEVLDSFRPLIQEKNISIKKSVHQRKMSSHFDKERIYQVLSNLLGNALKFTPVGGEISISLEEIESGENIFTIKDNGPGVKEENLPHIFEKYWTGGSGNGLGLFICKSIVESHGGEITVESKDGDGAKFVFTIPHHEDAESFPYKKSTENLKKDNILKTVYVIDDDEDLREVITWALEKEGYRVFSYNNPTSALEELDRTFYPPHLIVLDFHMGRMNGNDFLSHKDNLKNKAIKDCPVIMVSAAPREVEKAVSKKLYKEVLTKPVDLNRLVTSIKNYI